MGNSGKNRRLTIGLLADDIMLVGGHKALLGIVDVARKRDVNLMCFHLNLWRECKHMPASWKSIGEIIDGLVIYQAWPTEEVFTAFRNRFPSLPMVNAIRLYKGSYGLAPDSYQTMGLLVHHLIEVHGYRRIAFIRGPEGNFSANERFRSYVDTLAKHNLPLEPNLVTTPLGWDEGKQAVSVLIDERKLLPGNDFKAVVAANDTLALDALDELQIRGVQVPGDVAVVGFDDDTRAFFSTPPLTTAGYEMGRYAAETLLALLAGEQVPEHTLVPGDVVIRRSCGCQYLAVTQVTAGSLERPTKQVVLEKIILVQRSKLLIEMTQAIEISAAGTDAAVSGWMEQILDDFIATLKKEVKEESSVFLLTLEKILYQAKSVISDLTAWQGVFSVLRRQLLPYLNGNVLLHAESLWQQARLLIEETARREQAHRVFQAEQRSQIMRKIGAALITIFEVEDLMDLLADGLSNLDIPSAYLALYDDSQKHTNSESITEWSRLLLAYDRTAKQGPERVKLKVEGWRFRTQRLMPEGILPDRQYSFIIEPLYFQEKQLGFALFEMGPQDGVIYESLRGQISSALQGALLLEQVQEHAAQLDTIVTQTLTTSEEMQTTISETSLQAQAVSKAAQVSMDVSKTGQDAVANAITGMETIQHQVEDIAQSILVLSKRTKQIGEIIRALEDIVSQSKVLAINASIEAARAGNKGLGFAIVARKIHQLAEQSREATSKISNILNEIQSAANTAVKVTEAGSKGTQQGMHLAGRAGEAIHDLSKTIEEAARVAIQIAASTDQQTSTMEQLVIAVKSIKEATKQTSSSFKEAGMKNPDT